jgi:hypothetical protein
MNFFFKLVFLLVPCFLHAEIKPLLLKNSVEVNGKVYKELSALPALKIGDVIGTQARSYFIFSILQEQGLVTFKIGPKSSLTINEPKLVNLDRGSLFSKFEAKLKSDEIKLEVKTKIASLGVRGTYFFTSYGKGDDLWMCVKEGEVEVVDKDKKDKKLVKEGEGIFIDTKKLGKPQFYPWTKNINWNLEANKKIEQDLSLDKMYTDLLNVDYN